MGRADRYICHFSVRAVWQTEKQQGFILSTYIRLLRTVLRIKLHLLQALIQNRDVNCSGKAVMLVVTEYDIHGREILSHIFDFCQIMKPQTALTVVVFPRLSKPVYCLLTTPLVPVTAIVTVTTVTPRTSAKLQKIC